MKRILKGILGVLIIVLTLTSCKSGNSDKTINDLVIHLNENGFDGNKSPKAFAMIGALDGIGYTGSKCSIEIYKFKDAENIPDMLPYKNGNFGMIVYSPSENERVELVNAFNSFK